MKKLALTSLLAVFAVSGAHAANVIDGNPLYMPKAGHFYSVTDLSSHSETTKNWALGEEFGYGITDKFAVDVKVGLAEMAEEYADDEMFDIYGLMDLSLKATFRAFDNGAWKADVYGEYAAGNALSPYDRGALVVHSDAADDNFWFDKDLTGYAWTAGVRGGYVAGDWTVAGHLAYKYLNLESFNWDEDGLHQLALGLDAQYVIDPNWSLLAGVEYTGVTDDEAEDAGVWTGAFGVNYNIDATKYIGAYINGRMAHATGDWEMDDGFGFGLKFGIDF